MPQTVPAQVAANVRVELARHNMRQKELAERIGLKPAMLSHRLQGRTDLSLHEIDLIADALDVPVADPEDKEILDGDLAVPLG